MKNAKRYLAGMLAITLVTAEVASPATGLTQLKWNELGAVIANQKVTVVLSTGARVHGDTHEMIIRVVPD